MATSGGRADSAAVAVKQKLNEQIQYVVSGRLADVPPKRSKVVRIFLSSTFTGVLNIFLLSRSF